MPMRPYQRLCLLHLPKTSVIAAASRLSSLHAVLTVFVKAVSSIDAKRLLNTFYLCAIAHQQSSSSILHCKGHHPALSPTLHQHSSAAPTHKVQTISRSGQKHHRASRRKCAQSGPPAGALYQKTGAPAPAPWSWQPPPSAGHARRQQSAPQTWHPCSASSAAPR